jgi:hypothetical protein
MFFLHIQQQKISWKVTENPFSNRIIITGEWERSDSGNQNISSTDNEGTTFKTRGIHLKQCFWKKITTWKVFIISHGPRTFWSMTYQTYHGNPARLYNQVTLCSQWQNHPRHNSQAFPFISEAWLKLWLETNVLVLGERNKHASQLPVS